MLPRWWLPDTRTVVAAVVAACGFILEINSALERGGCSPQIGQITAIQEMRQALGILGQLLLLQQSRHPMEAVRMS
jgi:hypothetical protein